MPKQAVQLLKCARGHEVRSGTYVCPRCASVVPEAIDQLFRSLEDKANALAIPTDSSEILAMQMRELHIHRNLLRRIYTDAKYFGRQQVDILKSIRTATNLWLALVILGIIFAMLGLLGSCAGLLGLG